MKEAAASVVVGQLSAGDESSSDAFVENCPDATFFHLAGWRKVIERVFGHPTYYLLAERKGTVSGVLPLTHIKSMLFGNSLVSNAFCVWLALVNRCTTSIHLTQKYKLMIDIWKRLPLRITSLIGPRLARNLG